MKRFSLIIAFLLMALPGLRGNCANPTHLSYSNPDWQQENFTFLFVSKDQEKARLKNQARMISVIRELYGAFGDSIILDAAGMIANAYNKLKDKNKRYFRQEIIIYFFFNKYTGKLDTVRGFFSLPKTSRFYKSSFSEFIEQHFEEIINRFVKKYHDFYVTLDDMKPGTYARLKQEKKWKNEYDYYFQKLYKNEYMFADELIYFFRIGTFYISEFKIKTGKELLDYICSFEDCPIKTNEDFGVFREDYVK